MECPSDTETEEEVLQSFHVHLLLDMQYIDQFDPDKKDIILRVFYRLQLHETFFDQVKNHTFTTKDQVKIKCQVCQVRTIP
jgi:hypothetical protein